MSEQQHTAERDAPREHYLYVNMRDVGCNCGERAPDDSRWPQEAREAWFSNHLASVLPPGEGRTDEAPS